MAVRAGDFNLMWLCVDIVLLGRWGHFLRVDFHASSPKRLKSYYESVRYKTQRSQLLNRKNRFVLKKHQRSHTSIHEHKQQPAIDVLFGQQVASDEKAGHGTDFQ